jgi:hypothetical protein
MKYSNPLYILFLLLIVVSSTAQVPGYQGKRFLLEAVGTAPMSTNFYKISFKDYTQKIQFTPRLSLELVTARKQSLALSLEKRTTSLTTPYQPFVEGDPFQGNGALTYKKYTTQVLDMGGEYRFFMPSAWCLAPLGKYMSLGVHYSSAKNELGYATQHWMPTVGFGRRHIVFNHFSIHYGAQLGRTFGAWKRLPLFEDFEFNIEQYNQGIYKYNLEKALSSSYFLRVFLAVGGVF